MDIDLETIMQPDDMDRIGAHAMSDAQRKAIAAWGMKMYAMGQFVVADIAEIKYGGRLVILDDGTRWEVDELDSSIVELWSPSDKVAVIEDEMYRLDELEKISVEPEMD